MAEPSTPLDLDAIRARYDKIKSGPPRLAGFNALRSARDVPDLLAEVERLRAELGRAERERDLAIAHDRQPYPTAWAYDRACEALWKHRDALRELVTLKDGTRGEDYERRKPAAWDAARRALGGEVPDASS